MKKVSACASLSAHGSPIVPHFMVAIPTSGSFVQQWDKWIWKTAAKHFVRDHDRIPDAAGEAILRLLAKDTIGRWFYKHETSGLVDRPEAERMLGGAKIMFISQLSPVEGRRGDPNSLWKISDILAYAKFDYERFYYSIQKHTIDSTKMLRLLGYGSMGPNGKWQVTPKDVSILESLYRQGRLKPAELTEHECTATFEPRRSTDGNCVEPGCGKKHFSRGYCNVHYGRFRKTKCAGCDHGRKLLASRGLSLTHRWGSAGSFQAALKLRWNDPSSRTSSATGGVRT